jgi:hydroxymethylglutaryl-CoA lyase
MTKWCPTILVNASLRAPALDFHGPVSGLDRAMAAGVTDIAVFAASTEAFSRKNINQSIDDSLAEYKQVSHQAAAAGLRVRGYLSTAFGCPYEGEVAPARVAELVARLVDLGVFEVSVSDTIGIAHPGQVPGVLDAVLARVSAKQVALHFHDTRGTALANALVGLELGIRDFDAAVAGLGGCPYAPGAAGNLATEDLVYLLDAIGMEHGVALDGVLTAARFIADALGRPLATKVGQAGGWDPATGLATGRV